MPNFSSWHLNLALFQLAYSVIPPDKVSPGSKEGDNLVLKWDVPALGPAVDLNSWSRKVYAHGGVQRAPAVLGSKIISLESAPKNCTMCWQAAKPESLMPWMELDDEYLYLSQAENIQAYHLCAEGTGLQCHPQAIFSGHQEDVCRFVLVNSHIVSGGGDGSIVLHKIHGSYSVKFSAHEQEVNCVDFQGGLIVSGSRDRTAKVWSLSAGRVGQCLHTVQTEDRVWSIAISPLLSSFVTGTACCDHTSPLRIWDLESGQLLTCLGTDFHRGAGVLDVFYETPSLLLSCGYDTYIRYWDIRTSTRKCVQEWEEPHDSALYCIRSDKNHMIASGSSYYGVVRLWDKRQTRCLQSFHLSSPTSSPVYCLRFSTTHLYAALASALHVLDFTAS
ncbi:F-box/WD repeat-containing protein 4 [Turdus rufiventris]|nr:F-box/WD repeat-containing protein 4 [Turdus rufiventris]